MVRDGNRREIRVGDIVEHEYPYWYRITGITSGGWLDVKPIRPSGYSLLRAPWVRKIDLSALRDDEPCGNPGCLGRAPLLTQIQAPLLRIIDGSRPCEVCGRAVGGGDGEIDPGEHFAGARTPQPDEVQETRGKPRLSWRRLLGA